MLTKLPLGSISGASRTDNHDQGESGWFWHQSGTRMNGKFKSVSPANTSAPALP
jgi:hypothetical protein